MTRVAQCVTDQRSTDKSSPDVATTFAHQFIQSVTRMAALLISLPLLTFIADIAGLIGTLMMATMMLDIPLNLAIDRFLALDPWLHFRVGMIKAPFFALFIGMIGTYRGFYVESSADAVGRNTTRAVVESIFMVIAVDAIFSMIFTEIGW